MSYSLIFKIVSRREILMFKKLYDIQTYKDVTHPNTVRSKLILLNFKISSSNQIFFLNDSFNFALL